MPARKSDRRRTPRVIAAHPVVILGRRGAVISRGRMANVSEDGAFVVADRRSGLEEMPEVTAEIELPSASAKPERHAPTRTVRYRCRVVRAQVLGQLLGLGLAFIEKLN